MDEKKEEELDLKNDIRRFYRDTQYLIDDLESIIERSNKKEKEKFQKVYNFLSDFLNE